MSNPYHHLSSEECAVIMFKRSEHCSMRAIARPLHRPVSTISCELRRADATVHDATQAAKDYAQRAMRSAVGAACASLFSYRVRRFISTCMIAWFTCVGRPNKSPSRH